MIRQLTLVVHSCILSRRFHNPRDRGGQKRGKPPNLYIYRQYSILTERLQPNMDIDKLFKVFTPDVHILYGNVEQGVQASRLPKAGGNKRRMPDAPTPEVIKRMRVDEEDTGTRPLDPPPNLRKATVEELEEDGDERMGDEEFAPGNDPDYFAEEDAEGRFFGGGLTSEQKDILNIFDQAGGEGVQADVSPDFCHLLVLMFKTHF